MSDVKPRLVNCPVCGALVAWSPDNPYRPFCGQRCKLIDLGEWAAERYRVPAAEPAQDEALERPGAQG